MKKLIFLILMILPLWMLSQQTVDTIEIKTVKGKKEYFYKGEPLTFDKLIDLTKSNEEASIKIKAAKNNIGGAKVLGYAGGFMIGYTLGVAIGGGDPPWLLAAAGVGVIVLSIPLNKAYQRNINEAANIYNKDILDKGKVTTKVGFGPTKHGVGITVSF